MELKLSDIRRFFESKGIDVGFCRICGSHEIKTFGDLITTENDNVDANILVVKSEANNLKADAKETLISVKMYCANCSYENSFNAEIINHWLRNNSEV